MKQKSGGTWQEKDSLDLILQESQEVGAQKACAIFAALVVVSVFRHLCLKTLNASVSSAFDKSTKSRICNFEPFFYMSLYFFLKILPMAYLKYRALYAA